MKKVLAIGAHYDDVEIGTAGTLMKHVERGDSVYVAVLNVDEFRTGDVNIRRQEQMRALELIGIKSDNLLEFQSQLRDSDVVGILDGICADIIYTLNEKDTHQDHIRCSRIGSSVGRKKNTTTFFYDSGSAYAFNPNIFSAIDFDKKSKIFDCFASQIDCGAINLSTVKSRESYWGTLISEDPKCYAEGFMSYRLELKI